MGVIAGLDPLQCPIQLPQKMLHLIGMTSAFCGWAWGSAKKYLCGRVSKKYFIINCQGRRFFRQKCMGTFNATAYFDTDWSKNIRSRLHHESDHDIQEQPYHATPQVP